MGYYTDDWQYLQQYNDIVTDKRCWNLNRKKNSGYILQRLTVKINGQEQSFYWQHYETSYQK